MTVKQTRSWMALAGRLLLLAGFAVSLSAPLWGQCAMCRQTASYQREKAVSALNRGILVLAIPPVSILFGIGWVTYRHWRGSA